MPEIVPRSEINTDHLLPVGHIERVIGSPCAARILLISSAPEWYRIPSWIFLGATNGIQEVARSIRVSSTNKIRHLERFARNRKQARNAECMQPTEAKLAHKGLKEYLWDLGFWVSFATLLAVVYYACLTRRILIADTRPVVAIRAFIKSCTENGGAACAMVQNLGRNTAMAHVRKRACFSDTRLPKGPDLPSDQQHIIIPPGDIGNRIDFDAAGDHGQERLLVPHRAD